MNEIESFPSLVPSLDSPASSLDVEPPFFCGEFGQEVVPLVVALDRRTGKPRWRSCAEQTSSESSGVGSGGFDGRLLSARALVTHGSIGVGTVDAFDTATGERLVSHPATDWMPVAAVDDLVIEARGIGFTEPLPGAHPADFGQVTMRAFDLGTGDTRWTLETVAIPPPYAAASSITAGDELLAVAGPATTVFYDIDDREEVRREDGQWRAEGDLLIKENHSLGGTRFEVLEADGTRLSFGDEFGSVGYGTSSTDLLVTRIADGTDGTEGTDPTTIELIDRATQATNCILDHGVGVDGSDGSAALIDGSILRLVDGMSCQVIWTYDATPYGVRLVDAQIGDDLVLVVPAQTFG